MRGIGFWVVAAATASTLACASVWDVGALEARYPELAAVREHDLGDATPYVLAFDDELTFFLCRWSTRRALSVSLPPDASSRERALFERALDAWEQAISGLEFEAPGDASDARIEIRFGAPTIARSAQTGAECAVNLDAGRVDDTLAAELVAAQITLRRAKRDWRGVEVAFTDEELLGSALHEIGHALGFQGHVPRGDSVMSLSPEIARRRGRRLLQGEGFRAESVAALYRVPSGSVVARHAIPTGRTDAIDLLRAVADSSHWRGPIVRVGDEAAYIRWDSESGGRYGFFVSDLHEALREPNRFVLEPDLRAASLLEQDF